MPGTFFPLHESKVLVSRSERTHYARETMQVDRACNSKKRHLFNSKYWCLLVCSTSGRLKLKTEIKVRLTN